jgi:hypothetical protein
MNRFVRTDSFISRKVMLQGFVRTKMRIASGPYAEISRWIPLKRSQMRSLLGNVLMCQRRRIRLIKVYSP